MQFLQTMLGLLVACLSLSGAVALKSKESKAPAEKFGFYFPVHSQIPSTLNVLKSVRTYYPNSPIYLLQDGGNVDFGKLCQDRTPAASSGQDGKTLEVPDNAQGIAGNCIKLPSGYD